MIAWLRTLFETHVLDRAFTWALYRDTKPRSTASAFLSDVALYLASAAALVALILSFAWLAHHG